MAAAKPYKRRNYFTKKGFQSRFTLRFLAASALANIITVTLFIVLARKKIDGLLFSMRLHQSSAGAILSPIAFFAIMVALVSVGVLFFWAARGMYHKISVPLHQIRADLHKIGDGDLGFRIVLRNEDEFKDFAGEVNVMVEGLNQRFAGLKKQADDLAKAVKTLWASSNVEESRAICRNIKQGINSLNEQIRGFKR